MEAAVSSNGGSFYQTTRHILTTLQPRRGGRLVPIYQTTRHFLPQDLKLNRLYFYRIANTQYSLCLTVPVHLLTSSTAATTPPAPTGSTSALGHPDSYGCTIDSTFYTDGAQVGLQATWKNELRLYGCFLAENHLRNVEFSFRYQEIPASHVSSATASATRRHASCKNAHCK
jgi:hypothetical protein